MTKIWNLKIKNRAKKKKNFKQKVDMLLVF